MIKDQFVHLHTHTEYSILDGAAKLESLAARVSELGQPAVAMTDHGNLHGAFEFYKTMTKHGIKPIIGMEAYMAPTDVAVKEAVYYAEDERLRRHDVSGRGAYTHLSILARTDSGLRNLFKLHGLASAPGRAYYKPRLDLATLREHSEGLLVLSGCAGGRISTHLRLGQTEAAYAHAADLREIFGSDFYIEVMYHGITDTGDDGFDEKKLNEDLIALATDLSIPLVATNDSHYVSEGDSHVHDALLCVQTRAKMADQNRFRFTGSGFYIKSRAEMEALGLPREALDNTLEISDKVEDYSEVFKKKLRMPKTKQAGSLREIAYDSPRYQAGNFERLEYELQVIEESGYEDYFKIKAEVINWAKGVGIPIGPGRGSAGGSYVSFLVGITDIDPVRHGLLFERFLNPERVSLPDIDTDISDQDRDRFLEHLRETYGYDKVAQIMTLGTVGAKAALKDATRVLGYPYAMGEELVSYLPPPVFGVQPTLDQLPAVEGKERQGIVKLAGGLEGLIRNTGVHAAGVVVSPVPLDEVMPTWSQAKAPEVLLTGWDAGPTEDIGLVKMDFLGLRNLGVVKQCLDYINSKWSSLLELPLDDKKTLQMLGRAESDGVFQLDSDGMKRLLKSVKVDSFSDVVAVLALYRPGPMGAGSHTEYAKRKNGKGQKAPSIHPEIDAALEPILKETYGLIVYQEQVMAALQRLCGWSLGKADIARKAMGKKDHAVLGKLQPEFESAMVANGYSLDAAGALWAVLLPFADYAFNKSHSVGYGLLSYWTAYLKAHFPIEYMTALLTSVADDPKRLPGYLEEVKRMGIRLLPPDVNTSEAGFTPTKDGIRYGLSAIKGFGENAFARLVSARPYKDLSDFYNRAPSQVLNIGVLRALIASGAMDSLEQRRGAHYVQSEELATRASEERKNRSAGKRSLFRKSYKVLESAIESARQRQDWELEHLGITLSAERMTINLKKALDETEWSYVADMLAHCSGDSEVVLNFQGVTITTEYRVNIDSLREYIKAMTWLEFVSNG